MTPADRENERTAEEELEEIGDDLRQMRWNIFVIRDEALALVPKLPPADSERMRRATELMRLLCERLDQTVSDLSRCETVEDAAATVRSGMAEIRSNLNEIRRDLLAPTIAWMREAGLITPKTEPAERIH